MTPILPMVRKGSEMLRTVANKADVQSEISTVDRQELEDLSYRPGLPLYGWWNRPIQGLRPLQRLVEEAEEQLEVSGLSDDVYGPDRLTFPSLLRMVKLGYGLMPATLVRRCYYLFLPFISPWRSHTWGYSPGLRSLREEG